MQIGIVAKKIGLSVDAIRFYERNALLPSAPRTSGGFRQYGESDVETLAFIRRVQGLGFKLSSLARQRDPDQKAWADATAKGDDFLPRVPLWKEPFP
jgi:MerR family Zn(II)-responsive transcriptional regulator of zntA